MTIEDFLSKWENNSENEFGKTYISDFRIELKRANDVRLMPELNRFVAECTVKIPQGDGSRSLWASESSEIELRRYEQDRPVRELLNRLVPKALQTLDERLSAQTRRIFSSKNESFGRPLLVIIAGAGFSAGFGVPVTEALSKVCQIYCPNSSLSLWIRNSEDWKELTERFPVSALANGTFKDIEHLLTVWTGVLGQAQIFMEHEGNPYYADSVQLEKDYDSFIWNLCYHLYNYGNKATQKDQFEPLVNWLKAAHQKYEIRFLTYNYDLIIETLIKVAGLEYKYLSNEKENEIPIRKLHGSINWGKSRGFNLDPNHPNFLYTHGNDSFFGDTNLGTPGSMFFQFGGPSEIITPDAKKEYRGLSEHVWRFALGDLASNVEKLLIVGYSFPMLDFYAEKMMSKYIKHLVDQGKVVTYINPDLSACNRVKDMLGLDKNQIKPDCWKIEHFTDLI